MFGESKMKDSSSQLQTQAAAQRFRTPGVGYLSSTGASVPAYAKIDDEEEETEIDDTGLIPAEIGLVMSQTGASRNKAVKALRYDGGDIVSAIMDLIS